MGRLYSCTILYGQAILKATVWSLGAVYDLGSLLPTVCEQRCQASPLALNKDIISLRFVASEWVQHHVLFNHAKICCLFVLTNKVHIYIYIYYYHYYYYYYYDYYDYYHYIKDIFNSTTQVWSATPEPEHFRLKTLPHLGKLFDLRGLNIDLLPATSRGFRESWGYPKWLV